MLRSILAAIMVTVALLMDRQAFYNRDAYQSCFDELETYEPFELKIPNTIILPKVNVPWPKLELGNDHH